jgi:hypothetical protein
VKISIQILFSLFTLFFTNISAVASVSYCNETSSAQEEKFILPQDSVGQAAAVLLLEGKFPAGVMHELGKEVVSYLNIIEDNSWHDLSGEFISNTSWKANLDVQSVHRQYYAHKLHLQETHPLTVYTGYSDKELFKKHLWRNTQFGVVHLLKEQWVADQVGNQIWIPVYGSLKKAYYLNQVSEDDMMLQSEAIFNSVFGVSDAFLIKAFATGLFKFTAWAGGKMLGQETVYLIKKQLVTARLSFVLSTEAPLEASTFLNRQGDNIVEIVCKQNARFIKYDLQTGETLICSYVDDIEKTEFLTFEDFRTISINTVGKSEDDIVEAVVREAASGANGGIVRQNWNGYANIFKANADEIAEAAAKIKNYRTTTNLNNRNCGYIEGTLNGKAVDNKIWISGEAKPEIEPQIFDAIQVEGGSGRSWLRNTDSEYKMLNKLADDLGAVKGGKYSNINGEIKIVSELEYCTSCQGVIQQFNEMFPNIKLILIDGAK